MSDEQHCRLYLISPPAIDLPTFKDHLKSALSGGDVGSFQLRLKDTSDADILKAANVLLPLCKEKDVAFILNDRPDLAVQCGADGVHLGYDDMPVKEARAIVGDKMVIGASAHASTGIAMDAAGEGADYVAFGAFYPTTSKPQAKIDKWGPPEPEILSWWQAYMLLPCVAIGGITPANLGPLVKAGADFIAAITAVWNHKNGPASAVAEFNEAIERAL